jgi:hypothetical protein
MIDFFGLYLIEEIGELTRIRQIAIMKKNATVRVVRVSIQMIEALCVEGAGSSD